MKNKNLTNAKKAKNDEFYTKLSDIENELKYYKDQFKDKIVYCNCDNPTKSEFCTFFRLKFCDWGLKKLIITCITDCSSYADKWRFPQSRMYYLFTGSRHYLH